jgi:diguanylate cyclase (GGDEF)-like protein
VEVSTAREGAMKLRNKALIFIGLAWLIFLAVTYAGLNLYLLRSFLSLEHSRVENDLARIDDALDQANASLASFTSDWAHWNDIYNYLADVNPNFITDNMTMAAFENSNINLMMIWNKPQTLLYAKSIDTEAKKVAPFPTDLQVYIHPNSYLTQWDNINKTYRGYILLSHKIMMVAAAAITDGNKINAPLGTLITGRYFSNDALEKVITATKVNLELYVIGAVIHEPDINQALSQALTDPNGHYIKPLNEKTMVTYILIKDVYGKPIGILRSIIPRSTYLTGLHAVHFYLATYLVAGLLFSIIMIWLLRTLIIKRLEKLDEELATISDKHSMSKRVTENGNDELSSVASEINVMMDIIQASQEQLELRVEKRTEELKKANLQLQQEISERKSIEKELIINKEHLATLAHYDNLTGVPNRIFFNEILNKTINQAMLRQKMLAVLFIDLDRFKNINDALGHPAGDMVLKEIAQRFQKVLPTGDVLARLSGDEFIIVLNDIPNVEFSREIADKILRICSHPFKFNTNELFLTASIGICIFPNDGNSLEDLQKNSDTAMYNAKRGGGNMVQYYSKEMNTAAHEHLELESSLRKAIQNQEFILYYQPKLDLALGKITGVEALIRWESPELGFINPVKFIPLAEETGLIIPIGEWALREACKTNKHWQDQGYEPISIAVNLSAKQFQQQNLGQIVTLALKESGLDAQYLDLEITETAMMDNVENAIKRLTEIKNMGVEISVDDFGTGYTSISYLKRFPIDVLKIDQSFIKGIPDNPDDIAIVSAVIAMAHNLSMSVVAEGVETEEQMQFLAEHNCDTIQGYFISGPLPEHKIVLQFLKREGKKL